MIQSIKKPRGGQSLIEIIIAISLVAILTPALIGGLVTSRQSKPQLKQRLQAITAMKEAKEAVLSVREKGWSHISNNGTFHPEVNLQDNSWQLSSGEETMPTGLRRKIDISDVLRDSSGAIVLSGGTYTDPSTKRVVITISWDVPSLTSIVSTSYITRHDNLSYTQTTQAVFDQGVLVYTYTTSTEGGPDSGEVILGAGGQGQWCDPSYSTQLDLPKSGKATSVTAVFGEAYAGTGENSAGESFADIILTDTNPPNASIYGTIDGYKTNDIFGEADYGYIATDSNSKEVVIISLSSLPFTEYGYFNAPGNEQGDSIFVSNSIGYVIVEDKLYNFDLLNKNGARPILDTDGVTLSKEGTSVYVVGSYAYVSIKGDNNVQLDIIDITNPLNIQKIGSAKVNNQSGQDVFVNETGTRAYIITNATSPTEKEFHIVNTEIKSRPAKLGVGYYTNGMSPEGVEAVTGNKAIIVGQGGEEYQVVDITNELLPVRCGGLQVDTGVFDSASVLEPDGDAYSYIVTGDALTEFKIITGGAGGQYESEGTFESLVFENGASTAFNTFSARVAKPNATDMQIQVAVANKINGSCNGVTYTYLGPNGSSSQYFTTGSDPDIIRGQIPFTSSGTYINPGSCFRYKVWFSTSDSTATPVLYDFTVNYSP